MCPVIWQTVIFTGGTVERSVCFCLDQCTCDTAAGLFTVNNPTCGVSALSGLVNKCKQTSRPSVETRHVVFLVDFWFVIQSVVTCHVMSDKSTSIFEHISIPNIYACSDNYKGLK